MLAGIRAFGIPTYLAGRIPVMFFFGSQIFNDTTYSISLIQKPDFSCSRQISDKSLVVQNTHRTPGAVWQHCCNDHMF